MSGKTFAAMIAVLASTLAPTAVLDAQSSGAVDRALRQVLDRDNELLAASGPLESAQDAAKGKEAVAIHEILLSQATFGNTLHQSTLVGAVFTRMKAPDDLKVARDYFHVSAIHVVGIAELEIKHIDEYIPRVMTPTALADALTIRGRMIDIVSILKPYATNPR